MKGVRVSGRSVPARAQDTFAAIAIIGAVTSSIIAIIGTVWFSLNYEQLFDDVEDALQWILPWRWF